MQTDGLADELAGLAAKATPGPWGIWREPIKTIQDAIDEAMMQVQCTDPIIDAMVMLDAGGKCPAMTGCGPTSDANADLIVALVNNLPEILAALRQHEQMREALVEAVSSHGIGSGHSPVDSHSYMTNRAVEKIDAATY